MANIIHKNACQSLIPISKKTVIASFNEGTRTRIWLESLNDQWQITSFLPETRTVCATVYASENTTTHISLTLPEPIMNNSI
jgi:hypothetical protein